MLGAGLGSTAPWGKEFYFCHGNLGRDGGVLSRSVFERIPRDFGCRRLGKLLIPVQREGPFDEVGLFGESQSDSGCVYGRESFQDVWVSLSKRATCLDAAFVV